MSECVFCGWNPDRTPARVWEVGADGVLPSQNALGGNHRTGYQYRKFRRFYEVALAGQLNVVPRADRFRAGIVTRYYGKGKRVYDHENFVGGCKPLVDVLKGFAVILDDNASAWRGYYRQERSSDGVDRFTVKLLEYA